MSLLVSFKGQFSPHQIEIKHPLIQKTQDIRSLKASKDISDFEEKHPNQGTSKDLHPAQTLINNYVKNTRNTKNSIIQIRASDIMTKKVFKIKSDAHISELTNFFENYSYRHILVEDDNNEIVGIVSDRDYLKARNLGANDIEISKIMIEKVFFASEHSTIQDISRLMFHENISSIPIVNTSYKLTGIVTSTDILKFLISTHSFDNSI